MKAKVIIELEMEVDGHEYDDETLKESIYSTLEELIEADELEYSVNTEDEDEEYE